MKTRRFYSQTLLLLSGLFLAPLQGHASSDDIVVFDAASRTYVKSAEGVTAPFQYLNTNMLKSAVIKEHGGKNKPRLSKGSVEVINGKSILVVEYGNCELEKVGATNLFVEGYRIEGLPLKVKEYAVFANGQRRLTQTTDIPSVSGGFGHVTAKPDTPWIGFATFSLSGSKYTIYLLGRDLRVPAKP